MTLRRFWLACALALACVLAFAQPALAKDFHITSIDMRCPVSTDGTMGVTETRRVEFNGNFHWAQWALDKQGSQGIELIGILGPDGKPMTKTVPHGGYSNLSEFTPPPGTYVVDDQPLRMTIKVGFDVTDATVPFVLKYRVRGAAKRWTDTSELFWKFVGSETDVPTDKVHVEVQLPPGAPKSEVQAWAHGPLTGVVAINEPRGIVGVGAIVTLDVSSLEPNTFVEGRILFPAGALSKVPVMNQPQKAVIEAQEAQLAEQANAQRRAAQEQVRQEEEAARQRRLVFGPLGIVVPFVLLGIVYLLWRRFGKEYKPDFPGGYYRDIPSDYAPPLVGALWRMGQPADQDIGATLMDLSLKGAIYMKPVTERDEGGFLGIGAHDEQTYELTLDREKLAQVDPYERDVANFLFDETMQADAFTIAQLRDKAKDDPKEYLAGLNAWKASVAARADELGWVEKPGRAAQVLAFLLSVLAFAVAIVGLIASAFWPVAFGIVAAIAAFVIAFFVTRRSKPAAELYAKYQGLERYMKDFGRMQEKPPASVVLWEQYLVLAVVFGIAEEVIQQMRVVVPEVLNDPTFQTAYWWAYPANGVGTSPVSSLSAGMAEAASIANSEMSSASGGGGGFSGGGGGGGGGGGFSAG